MCIENASEVPPPPILGEPEQKEPEKEGQALPQSPLLWLPFLLRLPQFGFVQGVNSISQTLNGLPPDDTYSLNFDTANRYNHTSFRQNIQVQVGGQTVTNVSYPNFSYFAPVQAFVTATAQSETLAFNGLGDSTDPSQDVSGDVTNVMVSQYTQQIAIANGGFEAPSENGTMFEPTGAGFTFTNNGGGAGIAANNSPYLGFGQVAPEGVQAAQLTGANATIAQSLSGFVSGTNYVLSFDTAGRGSYGPNAFSVTLDGTTLIASEKPGSNGYANVMVSFTTTTGIHTLAFTGLGGTNSFGTSDVTSFIDNVQILGYAAAPEPSQWAGLGIGMLGLAALAFKARKRA